VTVTPAPLRHTGSPGRSAATWRTRLLGAVIRATFGASAAELKDHLDSGRLQRGLDDLAEVTGHAAPQLGSPAHSELEATRVSLFHANPAGLPAPPYAGLAIDGEILGPAVTRLESLLAAHGYESPAGWTELPDHLAAIGAVLAADACPASLARRLEEEYLRPWLDRYAGRVAAVDETGVFTAITGFLARIVKGATREDERAPQA